MIKQRYKKVVKINLTSYRSRLDEVVKGGIWELRIGGV
uniref:Uncharacterized protein n=1 Tax=Rhizophora mucronata TaxID=61149 RepID=A0A2P2NJ20_RHIMU